MNSVSIVASGGHLTADTAAFGCAGDHLATELAVRLAEDLCGAGYTYRLLFEAADGFRCMTERLGESQLQIRWQSVAGIAESLYLSAKVACSE